MQPLCSPEELAYYQWGDQPRLLICAGIHGDEHSIIPLLEELLASQYQNLPAFVFIPAVSPSAVKAQTRVNERLIDLNRSFYPHCADPEVLAFTGLVADFQFDLALAFHEDNERTEFYLYDTGLVRPRQWRAFTNQIQNNGLEVYTGIDDAHDPHLGFQITNGYHSSAETDGEGCDGCIASYLLQTGTAKRILEIEIPMLVSQAEKTYLLAATLEHFVQPGQFLGRSSGHPQAQMVGRYL